MNQFTGESLPLTDLQHPILCNVHEYWRQSRRGRELPSRKDISPEDMRTYLSNVMLIDVSYRPLDFVYRVFGTEIARAYRKDYTGKSVRQLEPGAFAKVVWQQYLDVVSERRPCLHGIIFASDARYGKYQRLTLPLSSDGLLINKLLAVSIEDREFWETTGARRAVRQGTVGPHSRAAIA